MFWSQFEQYVAIHLSWCTWSREKEKKVYMSQNYNHHVMNPTTRFSCFMNCALESTTSQWPTFSGSTFIRKFMKFYFQPNTMNKLLKESLIPTYSQSDMYIAGYTLLYCWLPALIMCMLGNMRHIMAKICFCFSILEMLLEVWNWVLRCISEKTTSRILSSRELSLIGYLLVLSSSSFLVQTDDRLLCICHSLQSRFCFVFKAQFVLFVNVSIKLENCCRVSNLVTDTH